MSLFFLSALVLPKIAWSAILPELILLAAPLVLLAVSALSARRLPTGVYAGGMGAAGLASLGASVWLWTQVTPHGAGTAVDGAIAVDGFSVLVMILVSSVVVLAALIGEGYLRREGIGGPEYYVLAMFSAAGAMLMASADDLVLIFLGLEIMSIALYVLAGLDARRQGSGEAAMKYFLLGAFSSAIFLYGIALVYGATGSTNLPQIADFLAHNVASSDGLLLAGMALLLVGFFFKIAAVPFHMWTPDVYQGSPTPVTGFMAAVAKAGGFAALLRVFFASFGLLRDDWQPVIWLVAVVTLLVGAVLALVQRDVKRMLAYSSINHAGFILVGLEAATTRGIAASLYYLFVYGFMVVGTFAVVTVIARRGDEAHDLGSYRGLAQRQPFLAAMLALLLLAQAGVPLTTGFLAKLYIISAAVEAHSYALAVIAMVSAAIAAFFYLRVVVLMYAGAKSGVGLPAPLAATGAGEGAGSGELSPVAAYGPGAASAAELEGDRPEASRPDGAGGGEGHGEPDAAGVPATIALAIALCAGFTLLFGIWAQPVVELARQATLLFH